MEFDIYMRCPACESDGYSSAQQYWRHGGPCQGVLRLSDKALIICGKCRKKWKLIDTVLSCDEGRHNFSVATKEGYAAAISTSAHFTSSAGALAWLQSVLECL